MKYIEDSLEEWWIQEYSPGTKSWHRIAECQTGRVAQEECEKLRRKNGDYYRVIRIRKNNDKIAQ